VTLVRRDGAKKTVPIDGLILEIVEEGKSFNLVLFDRARLFNESKIMEVSTIEEAIAQTQAGVALVPWCGKVDCGHQLEDRVEANMLGEPQYQIFPEAACAVCGKKSEGRTYMARQY